MIDRATIDRILDTADIVEVIQEFVPLKKRGTSYLGLCPFHNEKTPSFTVSQAKGFYKCFGCGKAGNVVGFLMEHEKLSYIEAIKWLGRKYHIEIVEKELTHEERVIQNEREGLLVLSSFAAQWFADQLFNTDEGRSIGLSYFKERGFRQETLKKFNLGYSIDKRDLFTQHALSVGYEKSSLIKTGLSIENDNGIFDRFRGRIIFPIHSLSGQVLGFGGRILKKEVKTAKYLNSPESDIYHKSRILYGIFQARKAIGIEGRCYLVEGYTDVLSLHEVGIENVVASSGTSLTREQIQLIKRFTKNVTILYDGDFAGIKASLRGIDMLLEEGLNVKVVLLPDGEDPDSYSKKIGEVELKSFLAKSETDFINFKVGLLMKDVVNDPIKKAEVITDIVKTISVIPDSIPRTIYIKECSALMGISENILYQEVNKMRHGNRQYSPQYKSETNQNRDKTDRVSKATSSNIYSEREVIRILLKYGSRIYSEEQYSEDIETDLNNNEQEKTITIAEHIVNEIIIDDLSFENPILNTIFNEYKFAVSQGMYIDEDSFIKNEDISISSMVADLLSEPHVLSTIWKEKQAYVGTEDMQLTQLTEDVILKFKSDKIKTLRQEVMKHLKKAQEDKNDIESYRLMEQYLAYTRLMKQISDTMGERIIL